MKKIFILCLFAFFTTICSAQDLSQGLVVNDLTAHPMQPVAKPAYLDTYTDPSFGTTIRRITNAGAGKVIVPMYSTVQAWNADESLMILYNQDISDHILLDGKTYQYIRTFSDFHPADLEQIFWDFNDPDVFYYMDGPTRDFMKYQVSTQTITKLVDIGQVSGCTSTVAMGNDVQMMSWDSDVFTFRCANSTVYSYRLSTNTLTTFTMSNVGYTAPSVAPSGNLYYHRTDVYDSNGNYFVDLNESSTEHSCMGKLTNGNDAHFAISFAQGPQGGCLGDIIAHDLTTGDCIPLISTSTGYNYPQSGTHISALAHKNTEGGWVAASMMGYAKDGQTLLDQELVIAKADKGNVKVCRIGHHRSDEDDWNYWGEPHAVISPTGTRVLFASDWSGAEDGHSIDCYVVELPAYGGFSVNVSLWLEGTYQASSGVMTNRLHQLNLLPSGQPFNTAPWNYNGTEGQGWSISDYPSDAVDWVLVEFRSGLLPSNVVATRAGVLRKDGTVLFPQEMELTDFPPNSSVYVVVYHRNHLPTMSPTSIPVTSSGLSIDFRRMNGYTGTSLGSGQKELSSGLWALYAGNSENAGSGYEITGSDNILFSALNGNFNVYSEADYDLNGDVNGNDKTFWLPNSGIFSPIMK